MTTPNPQPPYQPYQPPTGPQMPRRLVRRTDDRVFGGICSGIAEYVGMDVTLVRLLTVVLAVVGFGSVVLAYLVGWVLIPSVDKVWARAVAQHQAAGPAAGGPVG
ncbi:PspC domain-containing protein [Nocardioides sp. SYSU D00038]|uniref:PspC domain-containing protein n=1 Tax=Nocardioides sp. SYSU D00038 TaxID=2812554 RepID=UPI0019682E4F|nr:PspC domain-containing protein [Nocardioides sp. SYSU D00038]